MHSLLRRQLKRYFGDSFAVPEEWRGFVSAVSDAYCEFDTDREMLERSLDLSSQELLQANSEMRAIFQAIPDLLFRLDCDGTILDYTAAQTSDFFAQPQELVGKRIQDVPIQKVGDEFRSAIQHVQDTKSMQSLEYRMVIRDRVLWYEARLLPLRQNQIIAIIRNISERKKAEERLLESEQQLECIIQGSPTPALVISKDHKVTHWNRALEGLTGIKSYEMIGKKEHWKAFHSTGGPGLADFLVDEDFDVIWRWHKDGYLRSRLLEEAFESTEFFPELDDDGKWLHYTAAAIRDSNGAMVGAIATFEDITDRKRAEEALRESEQRLSQIIDFLPDATFAIDLDGKVIAWNRAIEEMTGVKAEQILGKGDYEYALPFYGTRRPILIDLVFSFDEEIKNKYHFVKKEGDVLLTEVDVPVKGEQSRVLWGKARPLYDSEGNLVGAIEAIRDITVRRQAEKDLQQTNAYLENILDNSPDAIGIVDKSGRLVRWNKVAEDIYGYTFEEMKGKSGFDLYADKDELERMLVSLRREGSIKKWEMRMERKDGRIVPFEISIGLLKDGQNETLGSVCVARDLSEIKETLAALRASNDQLNEEIIERKRAEEEREKLITELQDAMSNIKTLRGMLPICSSCKKIRDDTGYWSQIESYIRQHSDAEFSHGICPDCAKKLYPEFYKKIYSE